jgi:hypothetical protein
MSWYTSLESKGLHTSVMESPMVGTGIIIFSHKVRVAVTYVLVKSRDELVDIRPIKCMTGCIVFVNHFTLGKGAT